MSAVDRVKQVPRVLSRYRAILVPLAVLTLIGLYVALAHGDIDRVAHAVIRADLRWVAAAIVCQFAVLICITGNYRLLLGRLGHQVSWLVLLRAHLRRFAVATLVPFGSPASYVLFVRDLSSVGVSGTDAMSAVLLYSAGGQAAFVLFTIGASAWLMFAADLSVNPIALAIALPVTLTWVALPFLALHSGTARIASWKYMPARVSRMMERLAAHDLSPRDLLVPMLMSLFVNIAGLGMLIASLHAVGQQPTLSGLLLARLAGQLAAHAIPVMQGAGVVELSLAGSLQQTGVAMSTATAAALLFRLAQFWLPLTLGIVLLLNFRRVLRPGPELAAAAQRIRQAGHTSALAISRAAATVSRTIRGQFRPSGVLPD